jgi:hypothetical protein
MIPGLSLIGLGSDSTIINTQTLVNTTGFVAVDVKDSCLFTGFQIIVYYNNDKGYGVNCQGNCKVILNSIKKAGGGFGFFNTGSSTPYINNNNIYDVQKGAVIFDSSPIVRGNNIFTTYNSSATILAGVYINCTSNDYKPTIDSNYIEVRYGNGIRKSIGSRPIIKNNVITFTQYGSDAIYLTSSDSAYIYNNLILIGTGLRGIYNSSVPYLQVINNYIQGRSINSPSGMIIGGSNIVKNNVVTNTITGIQAGGIQNLVVQYNNLWNNDTDYSGFTADTTNLSVDPMIVNNDSTQGELDFHLQKYSPLIDAGDPNILDKDSTRSDIGLYGGPYGESYVYVDLPPRSPVNLIANVEDSIITLTWNRNTEADFSYYILYRDTVSNFQIDSTKLVVSLPDTFYNHIIPTGVESLYFKLTGVDNQGNESNPSEEVGVMITSVKDEWKALNNYMLYQNYPNPFNPRTKIGYKLKERGYVKLYVYDIKGELVTVLVNQTQEAGYYEVEFSASSNQHPESSIKNLASGVYIYQILVSNDNRIPVFSDIKKMLLIK